jgi:glutamine synthetase
MSAREGLLTAEQLRRDVEAGIVDTVLVAVPDMQGRLQGKRLHARFFLDTVLEHGTESCNYLLAVDVDMNTVDGYALTSWSSGYGDFVMKPDLSTLRRVPWHEGTVLLLCDLTTLDDRPVAPAPRQILRAQSDRLAERGWRAMTGTELEFLVFRDTYEDAQRKHYADLVPRTSTTSTTRCWARPGSSRCCGGSATRWPAPAWSSSPPRASATSASRRSASSTTRRWSPATTTASTRPAPRRSPRRTASASPSWPSTTPARATPATSTSAWSPRTAARSSPATARASGPGFSPVFEHFLAGQLAALRDFTLLFAPNINSYKRFVAGSFAPTAVRWGHDNRTCALRVVGHGRSLRFENRVAGGDVNPYLAVAATIAAGLHGVEHELSLEPACSGNAYTQDSAMVPSTMRDALALWEQSPIARSAFGDEVVDHYANMARVELQAFDAADDRLGARPGLRAPLVVPRPAPPAPRSPDRCPGSGHAGASAARTAVQTIDAEEAAQ